MALKILQVTPYYYPEEQFGGPPLKIHELSKFLIREGLDVKVATFLSTDRYREDLTVIQGVPVQYLPWRGRGLRQVLWRKEKLVQLVREADIVHLFSLYNFLIPVAFREAVKFGKACVIEPEGMYKPRARNQFVKRIYHLLFTRSIFREAKKIIAASELEKQELLEAVADSRLVLRRNGIPTAEFENMPSGLGFREEQGVPDGVPLVIFMGRISPVKNLEVFISACHKADLQRGKVLLIGPALEPDYRALLETQIKRLGLGEVVKLVNPVYGKKKLEALAAADLFVLPSISESFGNAAAEAICAGVPTLVTKGCGIAAIMEGKVGLAVPATVEGLAAGVEEMLQELPRWKQVARRRELVHALSWEEPGKKTIEIYHSILAS
jgi:glycosyltransferase involved in cell wall biosynthesis